MIDISIQGIVKAFEQEKNILNGLTFDVAEGERIGILGKNGCGKTTLFRILTREVFQDEGNIVIASGKRLGLISQIPIYPDGYTVEDVLKTAHEHVFGLQEKMNELAAKMCEDSSERIMREYDQAAADFERLGGYNTESERNKVANGLEISEHMRAQLFESLSGGEKTRVNLARLILEDTDILLLDEPTNHLDLKATMWLEEYLMKFHGTVLAISHDRYFLDRVVQRCIEIVDGKADFYSGNYTFYAEEKERRFKEQLKKYEKTQKELKRLDESARRLYQWGTQNESLMKKSFAIRSRMERMEKTDRPKAEKAMKVKFATREFTGDEVLVIDSVSKSFGERNLFSDLQLIIEGGERIALIGDNGTGKSTLIKMIMGEELTEKGIVRRGPSVKTAYLPQIIKFENPQRSLLDTMLYSENCTPQVARNRLGNFRFSGEDVFKPVSALSGGEQSRLRLCILMREEVNFLILDEPTNHLDINSREWIEEAVSSFDEALLFVSHDRYFIEKFADRIWVLENNKITDFRGGYDEYLDYKKRQDELALVAKQKEIKTSRTLKSEKKPAKKKSINIEKKIEKIERNISKIEDKLKEINIEYERYSTDYEKLMDLDKEKARLNSELEPLYQEWEELSELN